MTKNKYEIKKVHEQGCTETYIYKNSERLKIISKDGWGNVYEPMEIIELLIIELNNKEK